MTAAALADVLVVDLTSDVGGAYAGKLLADLGARVVLVEPPEGSPLRHRRPAFEDGTGTLFTHLSGGKFSVVPGPDQGAMSGAKERLADLVWSCDVLLVDGSSPWQPLLPSPVPEHVIEADLSPFGRSGPYAGWRGSDIATWAMGGYHSFTGAPDREPLWLPGSQSEFHAGVHGAYAVMVALYERHRSGLGQRVELSSLESVLTAHAWLTSSWTACGQLLARVPPDLIRASDGWVYFMRIAPNDELFVLIERPDLGEENLTADIPTWMANVPRIFEAAAEWAKDHTVEEIVELAQALRVAVTPVLDAQGVAEEPQMAARDWWERDRADGPAFPGQPYHLSASPSRRAGPAPALGEHTEAVTATYADRRHQSLARSTAAPRRDAPLQGLRVVEVTNNWAGPVAGRFLGDLGADVVKIEWSTRPATRVLFWVGPAQDMQRQPEHRAMYFNEINRNKRDVCLDLSKPEGKETFLQLIRTADVLIENQSARVMPNLGLDWSVLKDVNPGLIMVSMSGYGATGPRRDWVAYGANIETTSSLTSITGYPDGQLSRTTLFYADPVSGIHAAAAVMGALEHRRRSGEGQWIDMSLNECGAGFCAESLTQYQTLGTVRGPAGNRDPRFAPQGAYRCAGSDHWVAISVQDDTDWVALAHAMDRPDLAADSGLATLSGRQQRHDELDTAINQWTAGLEQYEVAWALQRRGVSAAPILANWQILPDPHLHARGVYQPIEHPVVGVYPTMTWPWRFDRTPARLARPAPLFAEHNREILTEIGLDTAAIDALYATGVTADTPAG
ncbi:MAG: CaiB/BaiF CoA transferase family protein [Acidimicrobiales bacterium]